MCIAKMDSASVHSRFEPAYNVSGVVAIIIHASDRLVTKNGFFFADVGCEGGVLADLGGVAKVLKFNGVSDVAVDAQCKRMLLILTVSHSGLSRLVFFGLLVGEFVFTVEVALPARIEQ